jgi:hypothetical protein
LPVIVGMFFLTLHSDNLWSKFLRLKPFLILGQISFSIYLTHTIAIEMFVRSGEPETLSAMWIATLLAIPMTLFLSAILNFCLERPYFNKIRAASTTSAASAKKITLLKDKDEPRIYATILGKVVTFSLVMLFFVWTGFRVPVAMTALVVSHYYPQVKKVTALQHEALRFDFVGQYSNLGMMFVHLRPLTKAEQTSLNIGPGPDDLAAVNVKVTTDGDKEIASNNYPVYQISDSHFHPIGLPLTPASQNQNFTTTISLTGDKPMLPIAFVNDQPALRTAYFFTKKESLTQPKLLSTLLLNKLIQPFQEKEAHTLILYFTPLLGLLLIANIRQVLSKK